MSIVSGAQSMGQSLAESLMVDTVVIRRKTGSVPDQATGEEVPTYATVYSGKCKFVLRSYVVSSGDSVSELVSLQKPRLDIPVKTPVDAVGSTASVTADDVFEITESEDEANVGVTGRIDGRFVQTIKTARRLPVVIES